MSQNQNQIQNQNYSVEINRPGFGPIYKQNHSQGKGRVSKDMEMVNFNTEKQNVQPATGFSKSLPITITNPPYYDPKSNGFITIKESQESDQRPVQGAGIAQRRVSGSRAVSASAASVRHRQNQNQNIYTNVNNAFPKVMSKAISTDNLNVMHHNNRESKDSPFFSSPEMKFSNVTTAGSGTRPLHSPIAFLSGGGGGGGVPISSVVGAERQRSASVTLRNGGGANRQILGQGQGQVHTIENHNGNALYSSGLNGERYRVPFVASDRKFTQMRIAHV